MNASSVGWLGIWVLIRNNVPVRAMDFIYLFAYPCIQVEWLPQLRKLGLRLYVLVYENPL